MTQEEKNLLFRVLSSLLPYKTIVRINNGKHLEDVELQPYILDDIEGFKPMPYLRPMSSMTEEEKKELSKKYVWNIWSGQIQIRYHCQGWWDEETECPTEEYIILFDWLNKKKFDYHGLIVMGLALKAPKEMYK